MTVKMLWNAWSTHHPPPDANFFNLDTKNQDLYTSFWYINNEDMYSKSGDINRIDLKRG